MTAKRVLIIEDDVFLVRVMQKKFQKKGFDVRTLTSGRDVIKTCIEFKPQVVLIDLILPQVDGFSTINKLKANSRTSKIPIVVASNVCNDEDMQKVQKMGILRYFIKSNVTLDEVIEYIQNL